MRAAWIFAAVGAVMLAMAARDRRRSGGWNARQRTWLVIGGVFLAVSLFIARG